MSAVARREIAAAVIALLVSIAIGSVLMMIVGASPGRVWWEMLARTVGDPYELGQVLYKATALALCGLSVAIARDAGLFNIGAEGQLTAGVLACAVVGHALPTGTPAIVAIPACVLAAAAAGGLVGGAIGWLRARRGAHEVITSIMLNAIVAGVALYLGNAAIFEGGTTRGGAIAPGAELPQLGLSGSAANVSIAIAVAAIAGTWWVRARTTWGRAWRAVGADAQAAESVGISVARVQTLVMAGAGALAGLAATDFVLGHKHAFEEGLGRGFGILGISAALLGRGHPVGVGVASILLAVLSVGGLAVGDMVPKELTEMLQGVVVLAVAGAAAWLRSRPAEAAPATTPTLDPSASSVVDHDAPAAVSGLAAEPERDRDPGTASEPASERDPDPATTTEAASERDRDPDAAAEPDRDPVTTSEPASERDRDPATTSDPGDERDRDPATTSDRTASADAASEPTAVAASRPGKEPP